ncbi:unnamed protein product [Durusdinium trenchii]|uniref:Uncharacterized protein n=1 Tax=Durusdinium trenchii TaxID=1381693 RepID=A0ABP0SX56_9DINO
MASNLAVRVASPSSQLEISVDATTTVAQLLQQLPRSETSWGVRMLSCGVQQLGEGEMLQEVLSSQAQCGEVPLLSLADYSELGPRLSRTEVCRIPRIEYRGITVEQLCILAGFTSEMAPLWCEMFGEKAGDSLKPETFNLYHLCHWVLIPSTAVSCCSLVELMATDANQQRPTWYISLSWITSLCRFVECVRRHASVRKFPRQGAYFELGCANNQHVFGEEDDMLNPRVARFARALGNCHGMLLVLDSEFTPGQRMWSLFELALVVERRDTKTPILLDVGTAMDSHASLLTDGLTTEEQQMSPLRGMRHKACREANFPARLLEKVLMLNISQASCAVITDKERILNAIAFPEWKDDELFNQVPPSDHANYDRVNSAIGSHVALACWYAIERNLSLTRGDAWCDVLTRTLQCDRTRRLVQLSFTGCHHFNDRKLEVLVSHLPPALRILRLDLAFTGISTLDCFGALGALPIASLSLSFTGSPLCCVKGLGCVLPQLQLRELHLCLSKLNFLGDIESLITALPCLRLNDLDLTVNLCPMLTESALLEIQNAANQRSWWRRRRSVNFGSKPRPSAFFGAFSLPRWMICATPPREHFDLQSPAALAALLKCADIRLVRGEFLLELHADGQNFVRRQEAEHMMTMSGRSALVTHEEVHDWSVGREVFWHDEATPEHRRPCQRTRIFSVSHCWESREHPDLKHIASNLFDLFWGCFGFW